MFAFKDEKWSPFVYIFSCYQLNELLKCQYNIGYTYSGTEQDRTERNGTDGTGRDGTGRDGTGRGGTERNFI